MRCILSVKDASYCTDPVSDLSSNPWAWCPCSGRWYNSFKLMVSKWSPEPSLRLTTESLREILQRSADSEEDWLLNPSTNAITLGGNENKSQRDVQLAFWTAVNSRLDLGKVHIRKRTWVWTPGGGLQIEKGTHELLGLAERAWKQKYDLPVAIDPWAQSIGVSYHQLWKDVQPLNQEEQANLNSDLNTMMRGLCATSDCLPECLSWVTSRTKIVIPIRRLSHDHSRSSSSADLHGAVFLTIHDYVQAVEALVHESAHQHLFMAETHGALVNPNHSGLYSSPLRKDPRPLRGVLLACHALAYMGAFYRDAISKKMAPVDVLEQRMRGVRKNFFDAQELLFRNAEHFTSKGQAFIEYTSQVGKFIEN